MPRSLPADYLTHEQTKLLARCNALFKNNEYDVTAFFPPASRGRDDESSTRKPYYAGIYLYYTQRSHAYEAIACSSKCTLINARLVLEVE